jgi:hypothetical protein
MRGYPNRTPKYEAFPVRTKALDRQIDQMKIQAGSFLSESLEAIGRQLSVEHRMLDVAVPQIMLDGTGIVTIIGELEPAGMP